MIEIICAKMDIILVQNAVKLFSVKYVKSGCTLNAQT